MLALVPIAGVPSELVLQDTLKSAMVAGGTLLAVFAWLWSHWDARRTSGFGPAPVWHAMLGLPWVLCVYAMASMAWAHSYLAAAEAARWAVLGLLLWVCLQSVRRDTVHILLLGIHIGAVGASAWGAAQFWWNWEWFPQAAGPASTFVNRNFFAEYLVCTIPFSAFSLLQLKNLRMRPLMALSLAFNLVVLMMTGTRSALLALALTFPVVVFVALRYRQGLALGQWSLRNLATVCAVFVAGLLTLGSLPSHNPTILQEGHGATALERSWVRSTSMAQPTEYSEGSFSIRATMWKASLRMVMDHPWSGVGAGAWEANIPLYQGAHNSVETDFYAHNEYLQLLGEYGLVVGGGFLAVLFAYLLHSAQTSWRMPPHQATTAALRAMALCSLLALLVVSNAGFPWRLASTGALFMVGLALLLGTDPREKSQPRHTDIPIRRLATASVALAGAALLAGYVTCQALRAEMRIVGSVHLLNAVRSKPGLTDPERSAMRAQALQRLKEGVAINPHYRKLTALAADQLAAAGDREGAAWALQSIALSRPNIPDVWANLVLDNIELERTDAATIALGELERLQPNSPRLRALELLMLTRSGQDAKAIEKITSDFDNGLVESDTTWLAYGLGLKLRNWNFAERALTLRAAQWPETAADSYFRLGNMYVTAGKGFESKALNAFQAGLASVPNEEKHRFRQQVPIDYRSKM